MSCSRRVRPYAWVYVYDGTDDIMMVFLLFIYSLSIWEEEEYAVTYISIYHFFIHVRFSMLIVLESSIGQVEVSWRLRGDSSGLV